MGSGSTTPVMRTQWRRPWLKGCNRFPAPPCCNRSTPTRYSSLCPKPWSMPWNSGDLHSIDGRSPPPRRASRSVWSPPMRRRVLMWMSCLPRRGPEARMRIDTESWVYKVPFRVSRGAAAALDVVVVTLTDADGHVGRGEAAGVDYDGENVALLCAQIEAAPPAIDGIVPV